MAKAYFLISKYPTKHIFPSRHHLYRSYDLQVVIENYHSIIIPNHTIVDEFAGGRVVRPDPPAVIFFN
jgi:hypothetical protein